MAIGLADGGSSVASIYSPASVCFSTRAEIFESLTLPPSHAPAPAESNTPTLQAGYILEGVTNPDTKIMEEPLLLILQTPET